MTSKFPETVRYYCDDWENDHKRCTYSETMQVIKSLVIVHCTYVLYISWHAYEWITQVHWGMSAGTTPLLNAWHITYLITAHIIVLSRFKLSDHIQLHYGLWHSNIKITAIKQLPLCYHHTSWNYYEKHASIVYHDTHPTHSLFHLCLSPCFLWPFWETGTDVSTSIPHTVTS